MHIHDKWWSKCVDMVSLVPRPLPPKERPGTHSGGGGGGGEGPGNEAKTWCAVQCR